ncbi:MAG: alpha-acetolactate decarboxylase [Lentimicrobiaceae bacterium]|jgi:acetolactate decarboxylase|nr:alpha-acetolactate decarboxylase [Lentimicrobiaceae bacterium]MBT6250734.1 alpha-acetolactate decarboxylase [Nitrosomonadales bacterium]MDB9888451.1 acetolactate decarboxylase [Polaribacter sp.]MBT4468233.1 alpha-acetolactate decarboxylase [Lentimicrobiaceae bacterium]MBT5669551.1 alpha-acetolactate decarboxylase [Lentimicrobiaceae bacterium]
MKYIILLNSIIILLITSCSTSTKPTKNNIKIIGAMKNVMWKGELAGTINLDTIKDKKGLYGIGPVEYLTGELLIIDGKSYVSTVTTDTTMVVEETYQVKAPFLVYANQTDWNIEDLPSNIKTIKELEEFIDKKALDFNRPFVFKLKGQIDSAKIHIQNLPKGTKVSSPEEAHQGQINYALGNSEVEIVGFFSTEHKGVFTHHDSNVHMHLITTDRRKMGHLDKVLFGSGDIKLYLPKK